MLKCSRCHRKMSEEEFSVNPKSGAFYKVCDKCRNKQKESCKKYRENNKEYFKEYYEKNKDKRKEQMKEYRENNKDKVKKQKKEYAQKGALYSSYKDRFHHNEEIREDEEGYLLVRCKYCNMLFNPTNKSVQHYLHYYDGTHNLYCSKGCKKSCPTFGQIKYEKGHKHTTSREVSPELRKIVLEKDDWECQLCGKRKDQDRNLVLHVHHINPVKINPILQNDVDNCITLCKKCHKKIHSKKGCRFIDLANCNIDSYDSEV